MSNRNFVKQSAIESIKATGEKWPSGFVARTSIKSFSGGLYSTGYCANLDSQNKGIPGAFRVGRCIAYPVDSVVNWLISKIEG